MATWYTTLEQVKRQASIPLDDTQDDDLIKGALDATQGRINRRCNGAEGLSFFRDSAPSQRVFQAADAEWLTVDPIADSSSITIATGQAPTFGNTVNATDFEALPLNATAQGEAVRMLHHFWAFWPTWPSQRVAVTAIWGWPAVPAAVIEAQTMWVARLFDRRNSPQGLSGQADFGQARVMRIDPDIEDMISRYSLPGFA